MNQTSNFSFLAHHDELLVRLAQKGSSDRLRVAELSGYLGAQYLYLN